MNLELKTLPQSEIVRLGSPCNFHICVINRFAMSTAVALDVVGI